MALVQGKAFDLDKVVFAHKDKAFDLDKVLVQGWDKAFVQDKGKAFVQD